MEMLYKENKAQFSKYPPWYMKSADPVRSLLNHGPAIKTRKSGAPMAPKSQGINSRGRTCGKSKRMRFKRIQIL